MSKKQDVYKIMYKFVPAPDAAAASERTISEGPFNEEQVLNYFQNAQLIKLPKPGEAVRNFEVGFCPVTLTLIIRDEAWGGSRCVYWAEKIGEGLSEMSDEENELLSFLLERNTKADHTCGWVHCPMGQFARAAGFYREALHSEDFHNYGIGKDIVELFESKRCEDADTTYRMAELILNVINSRSSGAA